MSFFSLKAFFSSTVAKLDSLFCLTSVAERLFLYILSPKMSMSAPSGAINMPPVFFVPSTACQKLSLSE